VSDFCIVIVLDRGEEGRRRRRRRIYSYSIEH
jgi:hypothetical protein